MESLTIIFLLDILKKSVPQNVHLFPKVVVGSSYNHSPQNWNTLGSKGELDYAR